MSDLTGDDRRLFERFVARFPVKYEYSRREFGTDVFLRDISASGMRIFTKDKIALNDTVGLEVEVPDGREPLKLQGRVVWIKAKGMSQWDAGLKFDDTRFMGLQRLYKFCVS